MTERPNAVIPLKLFYSVFTHTDRAFAIYFIVYSKIQYLIPIWLQIFSISFLLKLLPPRAILLHYAFCFSGDRSHLFHQNEVGLCRPTFIYPLEDAPSLMGNGPSVVSSNGFRVRIENSCSLERRQRSVSYFSLLISSYRGLVDQLFSLLYCIYLT